MSATHACPLCSLPPSRVIARNEVGLVIRDAYPVAPGHTLVIPVRHFRSYFEATQDEHEGLRALLLTAKLELDATLNPYAYNIGINDGPAAGQTIAHLHIHLIPRFPGDRPDPRGGVRWIFPEKADYWSEP
jgi:diadenosine tetraphosphate (Ap4A) HIT family hydrolase